MKELQEKLKLNKGLEKIIWDKHETAIDEKWSFYKRKNLVLSDSIASLEEYGSLADRVYRCSFLKRYLETDDANLKMFQTFRCKSKLCPVCNALRSRKFFWQIKDILDKALEIHPTSKFIFITLTQKNVFSFEMEDEMSNIFKGFSKFIRRKKFKDNVLGFVRGIEITYNQKSDTYHPHIHILAMVRPSYFKFKNNYLTQDEISVFWQKSMNLDYKPICHVQKIHAKKDIMDLPDDDFSEITYQNKMAYALAEVAKYPLKMDFDVSNLEVIDTLLKVTKRRRQIELGGIFKQISKGDFSDILDRPVNELMKNLSGRLVTALFDISLNKYRLDMIETLNIPDDEKERFKMLYNLQKHYAKNNFSEMEKKQD